MRVGAGRLWIKAALGGGVVLIATAVVVACLNATSFPRIAGRAVVAAVERATGWEIEAKGAAFSSPFTLALHDISFSVPASGAGSSWIAGGQAPRVQIGINPFALLKGDVEGAFGRVTWVSPQMRLSRSVPSPWAMVSALPSHTTPPQAGEVSPSTEAERGRRIEVSVVDGSFIGEDGDSWTVSGAFALRDTGTLEITLHDVELSQREDAVRLEVHAQERGRWSWRASGPADDLMGMLLPQEWSIHGALEASGSLSLSAGPSGVFEVTVREGDVRWGDSELEMIPFDTLRIKGSHRDGIVVDELTLSHGGGTVRGNGRVDAPLGDPDAVRLNLSLHAEDLALPASVPVLVRYGMSGTADFSGVLEGSLSEPELSGRVRLSDGTVWSRAVQEGDGVIRLRKGYFSFGQTTLKNAGAEYRLRGEWDASGGAGSLDVTLDSRSGRIEEILAAVGQESASVRGEVDGRFTFAGAPGALRVSGDFTARDVTAGALRFDTFAGVFTREGERIRVESARVGLGEGSARASGTIDRPALGLDVVLERWPLDDLALLVSDPAATNPAASDRPAGVDAGVHGWVSYTGRVEGTWESPELRGRVHGGDVRVGRWRVSDPQGMLDVSKEAVTFGELTMRGVGGGIVTLTGRVEAWTGADPHLDVVAAVSDASLSLLLKESGLTVPSYLLDGKVDGTIVVKGAAKAPDVSFDLALNDEYGFGEPLPLRFRIEGGRIRLQ